MNPQLWLLIVAGFACLPFAIARAIIWWVDRDHARCRVESPWDAPLPPPPPWPPHTIMELCGNCRAAVASERLRAANDWQGRVVLVCPACWPEFAPLTATQKE